jgi:hypothetical protein
MLLLYFAATLGLPFALAAHNEWEHRYRPPKVWIPLQPLAKVIQLRLVKS